MTAPAFAHLRRGGASLLLDLSARPRVLHWGADLGALSQERVAELAVAQVPPVAHSDFDRPHMATFLRENSAGFLGHPTILGHRAGTAFSPLFDLVEAHIAEDHVRLELADGAAALHVQCRFELSAHGVLTVALTLANTGEDDYVVNGVTTWLPVPAHAREVLDFTGRWCRERTPQRQPINVGTWVRESWEGRSGHDHSVVELLLGPDAGLSHGEVWAFGLAWSGNLQYRVERRPDGHTSIGAGELLLPGEVILRPGQSYAAPSLVVAHSDDGIDGISARFHEHLRARPHHPRTPRPLTLNVWEAVYFDHDLQRLCALADAAAAVGVERFVLDDGWFHLRRDDHAGLGDWWVDEHVWPEGLSPLIDHVRGLGMEFGLWFEPEMVNPDSDLFRAHPDWIIHVDGRTPPEWRHQQVLNLAVPAAFDHVLGQMDRLLQQYDIAYIKWDHNRVLVDAGDGTRPAVRAQTLAFYRLVDELKQRHPGLEIESCASGGGRIDLGVIDHTDRFWPSDCTDALERQHIQRWTQVAVPPELLGSHVSGPVGHQTGRALPLSLRTVTALFGHAGIEWNLLEASAEERDVLRRWADFYKQWREVLHTGRTVRIDHPDESVISHGVIAQDRSRAVFAFTQVSTPQMSKPLPLRLPALDADADYVVCIVDLAGTVGALQIQPPPGRAGVRLTGRALQTMGITPDLLHPQQAVLITCERC